MSVVVFMEKVDKKQAIAFLIEISHTNSERNIVIVVPRYTGGSLRVPCCPELSLKLPGICVFAPLVTAVKRA